MGSQIAVSSYKGRREWLLPFWVPCPPEVVTLWGSQPGHLLFVLATFNEEEHIRDVEVIGNIDPIERGLQVGDRELR